VANTLTTLELTISQESLPSNSAQISVVQPVSLHQLHTLVLGGSIGKEINQFVFPQLRALHLRANKLRQTTLSELLQRSSCAIQDLILDLEHLTLTEKGYQNLLKTFNDVPSLSLLGGDLNVERMGSCLRALRKMDRRRDCLSSLSTISLGAELSMELWDSISGLIEHRISEPSHNLNSLRAVTLSMKHGGNHETAVAFARWRARNVQVHDLTTY
jgi:hypothetical protein